MNIKNIKERKGEKEAERGRGRGRGKGKGRGREKEEKTYKNKIIQLRYLVCLYDRSKSKQ